MKYLVLLSSLLILGCGSAGNGDEESETTGKEIADDYNEMQDRADAVGEALEQKKDDVDAALEEAEGDD
jgi:dsDNA-binding SOS-regulon protein